MACELPRCGGSLTAHTARAEYLIPGLHGLVDESMLALKAALRDSVRFAHSTQILMSNTVPKIGRLLEEMIIAEDLPDGHAKALNEALGLLGHLSAGTDVAIHVPTVAFPEVRKD